MTKYIDADNLINELSAACMPIYEKGITGILGDNSSIADIINEQPTADVQEVKHGYWKSRNKAAFIAWRIMSVAFAAMIMMKRLITAPFVVQKWRDLTIERYAT